MARNKVNTIFSEEEAPKSRKGLLKLIAFALAVAIIVLASVLISEIFGTEHLVSKNGGATMIDSRTDVTYKLLLPCPYWVNLDISDHYAECGDTLFYKVVYTDTDGEIKHVDPLKMIATVDDLGFVDVYLAQDYTLPTLKEMNPDAGFVYYVNVKEVPAGVLTEAQAQTVADLILNGDSAIYPPNVDFDSRRNIYLSSVNYIYIRYTVEYFVTEDGEMYLQDSASGKCVKATAELTEIFGSPEQ